MFLFYIHIHLSSSRIRRQVNIVIANGTQQSFINGIDKIFYIEFEFLLKTDLVTKRLNYISNLQNLYLVLRNIKLLLYYIIKNIKN